MPFSVSSIKDSVTKTDWKAELQPSALKGRATDLHGKFSNTSGGYAAARQAGLPPPGSGNVPTGPRLVAPPPGAPRGLPAASSGPPTPPARSMSTSSSTSVSHVAAAVPLPPRRNLPSASPAAASGPPAPPPRRGASITETHHHESYDAAPPYEAGPVSYAPHQQQEERIDWQNMSRTDKQALFSTLDNVRDIHAAVG